MKAEKKKLRLLADERDSQITAKDKEIDNMEKETKNLLKVKKIISLLLVQLYLSSIFSLSSRFRLKNRIRKS